MYANQSSLVGMPQARRPARVHVTNPDLEYPVESLAGGIQSAMRSLYNVQMSLIDCLSYSRSPTYILDDFKYIRGLFRTEWENDNNFLQNCYNYCDEWIALCDFASSMPPANQGYAAARDTLMLGTNVYNEARDMRSRHERLHKELRKHRHGLASVLATENSRSRGGRRSQMPPGVSNAHFFQETQRPSGMDSLTEAYASLSNISTAMGDIVVFLKDHVDHLNRMLSRRFATFPMSMHELRASAEKWSHSKSVLLAAMSSISESSDAVTVDPVVGSHFSNPPLMGTSSGNYGGGGRQRSVSQSAPHRSIREAVGSVFRSRR